MGKARGRPGSEEESGLPREVADFAKEREGRQVTTQLVQIGNSTSLENTDDLQIAIGLAYYMEYQVEKMSAMGCGLCTEVLNRLTGGWKLADVGGR